MQQVFYETSVDVFNIYTIKMKVKVTLEQVTKAHRGSRSITLLFLYPRHLGGGWSTPSPGRFTPGKDAVPIL